MPKGFQSGYQDLAAFWRWPEHQPKPALCGFFFVSKSQQSISTVLALVSEPVSTNSHESEGIGNNRIVRVRKAGSHHFAPTRNGVVTNS